MENRRALGATTSETEDPTVVGLSNSGGSLGTGGGTAINSSCSSSPLHCDLDSATGLAGTGDTGPYPGDVLDYAVACMQRAHGWTGPSLHVSPWVR